MVIKIDHEKCTLCGECMRLCLEKSILLKDGKIIIDEDNCWDCELCVAICPELAVTMTKPYYNKGKKREDSVDTDNELVDYYIFDPYDKEKYLNDEDLYEPKIFCPFCGKEAEGKACPHLLFIYSESDWMESMYLYKSEIMNNDEDNSHPDEDIKKTKLLSNPFFINVILDRGGGQIPYFHRKYGFYPG